jgi:hypothetical protein
MAWTQRRARAQKTVCLAGWKIIIRPKWLGGSGVRDLELVNKSLMLNWMWQWVLPNHAWWKEAIIVIGLHVRPWEMQNTSKLWSDISALVLIFKT